MNKVILIGGNHHNILGTVRSFGVNHICPYGIIVGQDARNGFVRKSKYWAQTWVISSDKEVIDFLISRFSKEIEKPVLVCCSDSSAEIIDSNYSKLRNYFILPSIDQKQGNITKLMDKYKQIELAKKYDIPFAKTSVINLAEISLPQNMAYPCIIKPIISASGKKSDIKKCENEEEVVQHLKMMKENGYSQVLIQEYIKFDSEYLMVGASHGDKCCWFNSKKIRVWPVVGGSSSYLEITKKREILKFYDDIRMMFRDIGYDGLFDVEAFFCKGKVYLNEINWRNSGTIYSVFSTKVYYPVIWYYWVTNQEIPDNFLLTCENQGIRSLDESLDLRHVVIRNITLKQWIKDVKQASAFAIWFSKDLKPTFAEYAHLVKEFIKRCGV